MNHLQRTKNFPPCIILKDDNFNKKETTKLSNKISLDYGLSNEPKFKYALDIVEKCGERDPYELRFDCTK